MSDRIAVLTTSYPRAPGDAAGHFVASEVLQMARAGHEVHVFAPGSGEPAAHGARTHWLADHGAFGWPGAWSRLQENPARVLGVAEFAVRATRQLRALGPFTRMQAHFLVPSGWPITTLAIRPSTHTKLELVGHGSDVRAFCRLAKPLRKHIARAWLARRVQLRLSSRELATLLNQKNPELSPIVRVEVSPIEVRGVPQRRDARRALGVPDSAFVAVMVSRLVPQKCVATALRALALLDDLTVVVVGDGPELAQLSARFPRVRFTGRVARSEALAIIAAADVLVSASPHEGAPTVVREARALGVPVVAVVAGDLAAWAAKDPGILLAGD